MEYSNPQPPKSQMVWFFGLIIILLVIGLGGAIWQTIITESVEKKVLMDNPGLIEASRSFEDNQHIISGEIEVPDFCYEIGTRVKKDPANSEKVIIDFYGHKALDEDQECLSRETKKEFKVGFTASEEVNIEARFNNEPVELQLEKILIKEETITLERTGDFERLIFDFPDDLTIGNQIGPWRVEEVGKYSDTMPGDYNFEFSESNFYTSFTGSVSMRGVLSRVDPDNDDYGALSNRVCFTPDDDGSSLLPQIPEGGLGFFCFSNEDLAKEYIAVGEEIAADIIISSYYYFIYPIGAIPYSATLEEVLNLYPNWEEIN